MSKEAGYQCEFLDEVPDDYICVKCKNVAREATITVCCGETFCKVCLANAEPNHEHCPSCSKTGTTSVQQAKYQKAILSLAENIQPLSRQSSDVFTPRRVSLSNAFPPLWATR